MLKWCEKKTLLGWRLLELPNRVIELEDCVSSGSIELAIYYRFELLTSNLLPSLVAISAHPLTPPNMVKCRFESKNVATDTTYIIYNCFATFFVIITSMHPIHSSLTNDGCLRETPTATQKCFLN